MEHDFGGFPDLDIRIIIPSGSKKFTKKYEDVSGVFYIICVWDGDAVASYKIYDM